MGKPASSEIFEIVGLFQLFAKIRVHGQSHIPRNKPCLIIVNHALGHGFDVPMMVYILRKMCHLTARILVSPKHFNYPIWADLVHYLGGVPRTHLMAEHLMANGENIIMFAAKKKKSSMIWDNKKHLYLDLVHKFDYVLVPAVCVSEDDVINMVYHIEDDDKAKLVKSRHSMKQRMDAIASGTDTDTDGEDEEDKGNMIRSVGMMTGRLRRGYRKQYHLRFSEAVSIPKDAKRKYTKHRKSVDYMEEDEECFENGTPNRGDLEVRWSNLKIKGLDKSYSNESLQFSDIEPNTEHKYDDSMDSLEFDMNTKRVKKRRWSRELEVGLKNAVEDAMTDGISEMFDTLKSDPNSSLLQTMQIRMNAARKSSAGYAEMLQDDLKSPLSTEIPIKGTWVD